MLKGRALLAPCLIIAVWVFFRIGSYSETDADISGLKVADADLTATGNETFLDGKTEPEATSEIAIAPVAVRAPNKASSFSKDTVPKPVLAIPRVPKKKERLPTATKVSTAGLAQPIMPNISKKETGITAPQGKLRPISETVRKSKSRRLALYGYAYWREAGSPSLAPAAQYGGSQAGLIATYRLGAKTTTPSLLARVSSDLDSFSGSEFALGLRWRPFKKIPFGLTAERRFRNDAQDAFAAYLAGGYDLTDLPFKTRLLAYGQAGIVVAGTGKGQRDYFYDGNAKIERQIASRGKARLSIGAGAWAGGQGGVNRVDVGPTAAIDFGFAQTSFRLSADYRFRTAGNASPKSGPAITLSASY